MSAIKTTFNLDKVLNTNSDLLIEESGVLNIKYSGTVAASESGAIMTGLITRDSDYLLMDLTIKFMSQTECSRCLNVTTNDEVTIIKEKFYIKDENEYDIDFKNEVIDIYPIISEKIIDGISLISLCKEDCAGLCVLCGKEQNTNKCKHEEKNLKESPFSSLSELDL